MIAALRPVLEAALVAALAMAACAAPLAAQADPPVSAAEARAAAKRQVRSSPGKPQPPIFAEHRLSRAPELGFPLVVTFVVRANASLSPLSIDVRGADGAELERPPTQVPGSAPDELVWEIAVAPLTSEAGRLNVLVTGRDESGSQSRSFAVSLRTAPARRSIQSAPSGERVIALPAQESR